MVLDAFGPDSRQVEVCVVKPRSDTDIDLGARQRRCGT